MWRELGFAVGDGADAAGSAAKEAPLCAGRERGGKAGAGGNPAEVPEVSGKLILSVGGGKLGATVFGCGKGEDCGDGAGDRQRERAQFEAREGGKGQADGRADEQGLLAPPRMRAEGAGDVQRDEGGHEQRGDEGREQVAHGVVPRKWWFTEDGGAARWF
ncbi:hypothetical protein [Shimia sp. NS0008-38b]|uniref:hypothetical protein n=1 Tax=Shimia sp. NS0008-38b TaxID=3127653 RepID=UPI00333FF5CF